MKFAASWNHTTKFSTTCAMLSLVILPYMLSRFELAFPYIAATTTVGVLIGAFSWGFGPEGYTVDAEGVVIHRPIQNVRVKASEIKQVKLMPREEMGVPIRVSGNGGLFGFYGRYYSRKLGWQYWYATRSVDLVGVESAVDGWIIVSPDDRQGFVDAVAGVSSGNPVGNLAQAVARATEPAPQAAPVEPDPKASV